MIDTQKRKSKKMSVQTPESLKRYEDSTKEILDEIKKQMIAHAPVQTVCDQPDTTDSVMMKANNSTSLHILAKFPTVVQSDASHSHFSNE